ncbi:MAG: NAD(P)-dependent oxidoreductase [Lentisphaeria bacterium]
MGARTASGTAGHGCAVIHFEALGPEAGHLRQETARAIRRGELPQGHRCLITPDTVQRFLQENPDTVLPEIITTKTHSVIPDGYFSGRRKSVVTRSAGYDHFEHLARKANIASLRDYCVNAVAQTAMKFLYAAAGQLNHYTKAAETFERKNAEAFLELGKHRVLTVFGVGRIGRKIYELAAANGLTVQGVDVRAAELDDAYGGSVRFVSRDAALASSDLIVNAMNLTKNRRSRFFNVGYFSRERLATARKGLIFINVTRGEIAPESGLLELYRSGRISGIGLDVFSHESEFAAVLAGAPAGGADLQAAQALVALALARSGNIYVQPHQGFNSDLAAKAKAVEAVRHVAAWYRNNGTGFDEQLPYYS